MSGIVESLYKLYVHIASYFLVFLVLVHLLFLLGQNFICLLGPWFRLAAVTKLPQSTNQDQHWPLAHTSS
jgi:hypothetical protein